MVLQPEMDGEKKQGARVGGVGNNAPGGGHENGSTGVQRNPGGKATTKKKGVFRKKEKNFLGLGTGRGLKNGLSLCGGQGPGAGGGGGKLAGLTRAGA